MKELVKRINEVRNRNNLSGRAFAKEIGASYTTALNYLNGTKEPSVSFIMSILCKYVDISAEWLMRGEGSMVKKHDSETEALVKELADTKVKLLVAEGITKELKELLLEKDKR